LHACSLGPEIRVREVAQPLVVLVGAGASYDCASNLVNTDPLRRPPLVKDLFGPHFADILQRYRLAQAAAADIRRRVAADSDTAIPLEQYLRDEMANSTNEPTRRRYQQIPLYLQDVLTTVGNTSGSGFTTDPDNYNTLVNASLQLDDVLFLTLNYDTLLDDRLFLYGELESMNSYVTQRTWALVKLHGSVNWGRRVLDLQAPRRLFINQEFDLLRVNEMFEDLDLQLDDQIELRHADGSLVSMRADALGAYYPALSVPLGAEDQLVCPSEHLSEARTRLKRPDGINLLVIGYSGLDREVLQLLGESGSSVRSMLVANGSYLAGAEAATRISQATGGGSAFQTDWVLDGGFSELITSGRLAQYLGSLREGWERVGRPGVPAN